MANRLENWVRRFAQYFPSSYGKHAMNAEGKCHTKAPDPDHEPQHRKED
jgi:hypothetical protein